MKHDIAYRFGKDACLSAQLVDILKGLVRLVKFMPFGFFKEDSAVFTVDSRYLEFQGTH